MTIWVLKKYININSIIEYNPSVIVSCFIHNIEKIESSGFQGEIKVEFIKVVETLSNDSILSITNLLAEELKEEETAKQRKEVIFSLFDDVFRVRKEILQDEEYCSKVKFLLNCEKGYSKELQK